MSLSAPWLLLPAKVAHDLSHWALRIYGSTHSANIPRWRSFDWRGLHFQNPLGIAGGVDKNAQNLQGWWALGAGFVEVGTVTPLAQEPNPGKIIDRHASELAVWNKMGFPNKGMDFLRDQLLRTKKQTPVFVNIGKNRNTAIKEAHSDYIKCLTTLSNDADVFVINISSPNTQGLRELLDPKNLIDFLSRILEHNALKKPILLKMSPDLSVDEFKSVLDSSLQCGIDGWVISNTTVDRTQVTYFPTEGGVSGQPLATQSKKLLALTKSFLGTSHKEKLIISAGGVMSSSDVQERLQMGAHLVQVYSALIYKGPYFFHNVARQMIRGQSE